MSGALLENQWCLFSILIDLLSDKKDKSVIKKESVLF